MLRWQSTIHAGGTNHAASVMCFPMSLYPTAINDSCGRNKAYCEHDACLSTELLCSGAVVSGCTSVDMSRTVYKALCFNCRTWQVSWSSSKQCVHGQCALQHDYVTRCSCDSFWRSRLSHLHSSFMWLSYTAAVSRYLSTIHAAETNRDVTMMCRSTHSCATAFRDSCGR